MQLYKVQMGVLKNLFFYIHLNSTVLVEVSKNNQSQIVLKITWATLRDAVITCACEIANAGVPVREAWQVTGQGSKENHHLQSSPDITITQRLSSISSTAVVQKRH